ncbi:MAG: YqaA family protein [Promethearchaeota archaeon]
MTDETIEKEKEKSFLQEYGGLLFIGGLIIFFIIIGVSGINFGQWLANTALWYYNQYGNWGIYIGIFLISIFGNFTVIFPVPYTIAIIVISVVVPDVNPFLIGAVAGLGAAIGETSAWLIGKGSQEMLHDSEKLERMKGYVDRGWAPYLVFIFAATPLPDDAFLIVLGLADYKLWKALIWCFLGKFVMCFVCAAIPIYLAGTPLGDTLLGLYGIDIEAAKAGIIPESTLADVIRSTIVWIVTIVAVFLLVYVDWGKIFKRFKKEEKTNSTSKDEEN